MAVDDDPEVLSRPYTEEEIRELAARAALTGRSLAEILTEVEATFQAWSQDKKASEAIFFSRLGYQDALLQTVRTDLANAQLAAAPLQVEVASLRTRLENLDRAIRQQIEIKIGSIPAARDLKAHEEWQRGAEARKLQLDEIDKECRELDVTLLPSAAQAVLLRGRGLHFLPGLMLVTVALFSVPGLAGAAAALFTNDVPTRDIMREGALAVAQNVGFGPQSLIPWAVLGLASSICAAIAYRARTLFHVWGATAAVLGMVAVWGATTQLGGTPLLLSTTLISLIAVTGSIFGATVLNRTASSVERTIAAAACSLPVLSLLTHAAFHNRIIWTVALLTGAILAMAGAAIGFTVIGNEVLLSRTRKRINELRDKRTELMSRPEREQSVPSVQARVGDIGPGMDQQDPECALGRLVAALGSDAIEGLVQLINQRDEASVTLASAVAKLVLLEEPIPALKLRLEAQERDTSKLREYVKTYNLHVLHRQRDFDTGRIRARLLASEAYHLSASAITDEPRLGQGEGAQV
jgi:hypothetical protein